MRHPAIPSDAHEVGLRYHFGDLDLRGIEEVRNARRHIIVCFTNRSGSNYLCTLLQRLTLMGFGRFEPLNKEAAILDSQTADIENFKDYYRYVLERNTSSAGNAAFKASVSQLNMLINNGLFTYGNRNPHLIYVYRRNLMAQACSFAVAAQTGAWSSNVPARPDSVPVFDKEEILAIAASIAHANAMFELLFSYYAFNVLRIAYEDLVSDTEAHLRLLRERFDLEDAPLVPLPRLILKQDDPIKAAWEARVREHEDFVP